MRAIITDVNKKSKYFAIIDGGRKYFFYLPNRLSNIFMEHIGKNHLIEFEAVDNVKVVKNRNCYEVNKILEITNLTTNLVIYSHKELQKQMRDVLLSFDYFLCTDFEMSMANYKQKGYAAEIIQAGLVLVDRNGNVIEKFSNYILPVNPAAINKFTLKFLDLDFDTYLDSAIEYLEFYEKLKEIMRKYNPKIIVWGKNDSIVLDGSYKLNNMPPLTKTTDFIDLLKLHKNFYLVKDDIGLFKAYQTYYTELENQKHDALEDAEVTKEILFAFMNILKSI